MYNGPGSIGAKFAVRNAADCSNKKELHAAACLQLHSCNKVALKLQHC